MMFYWGKVTTGWFQKITNWRKKTFNDAGLSRPHHHQRPWGRVSQRRGSRGKGAVHNSVSSFHIAWDVCAPVLTGDQRANLVHVCHQKTTMQTPFFFFLGPFCNCSARSQCTGEAKTKPRATQGNPRQSTKVQGGQGKLGRAGSWN